MNEKSKTIVFPDGSFIDVVKCRELIISYWALNPREKLVFNRVINNEYIKNRYEQEKNNESPETPDA